MPRPQFTSAQARIAGRKGGLASGKARKPRGEEHRRGYLAGWRACERFYTRQLRNG